MFTADSVFLLYGGGKATATMADYMLVFLVSYSLCSQKRVAAAVRPHYRSTQTILVSLH